MDLPNLKQIPLHEIYLAKERTDKVVRRTPLIPLDYKIEDKEIFLKLENLQMTGSFKPRGAMNALLSLPRDSLKHGVWTFSSGNFAQGLCTAASIVGVTCEVVVPDTIPAVKVDAIQKLGGEIRARIPFYDYWKAVEKQEFPGMKGRFVDTFRDPMVIAGHGVMGLEILEDCPDVDTIIGVAGSGCHMSGIASAVKQVKPDVKVIACEIEGCAPLTASFAANKPLTLSSYEKPFVDSMAVNSVFPEMWGMLRNLIDDTVLITQEEICSAIRTLLSHSKVLAEGAGAAPVAACLKDGAKNIPGEKIVCLVTGGNMDMNRLQQILKGEVPPP